jgi:hypothetical protein
MKRLRIIATIVILLSVLNGTRASATIITADSPEPTVPTAADLAYFGHPGPSFIEGHLVVNTKLFGTLVFPHTKVYLYPYTDYPAFAICACISTACSTRICYN